MNAFLIPFIKGFSISGGLIVAIGAQNAFVLKQGIMKSYLFIVALLCAIIDSMLIVLGVLGLGKLIVSMPFLLNFIKYMGAAFLFFYGARALYAALKSTNAIKLQVPLESPGLNTTILTLLMMTLLNPHVYLDTVLLIGSIGAEFVGIKRGIFATGAITASFIWFFCLSYGASYLAPAFSKAFTWRILDIFIAIVMWSIAASLICSPIHP